MSKREYIKFLTPGQSFIMDHPMGHRTVYVAETVFSEGGKTVVHYTVPEVNGHAWTLVRPSLTLITIEGN